MKSLDELTKRGQTPPNLKRAFEEGALLLDVRTVSEYSRTHIQGARHISYEELDDCLAQIQSWKKPVITYSTHGRRSRIASELLKNKNIQVYDGGQKGNLESLLFG